MKITERERESLHLALDYILNARAGLERIDLDQLPNEQWYRAWSKPRSELFIKASEFLRRVLGTKLHTAELGLLLEFSLNKRDERWNTTMHLANAIRSFLPLFKPIENGQERDQFISNIVEDLVGIHWGDEPRFFEIAKRAQGSPKRPFRVAYLRRGALDWEKRLKLVGMSAQERQSIISTAYKTSWEAIRKWAQSILQFDLISHPPRFPQGVREFYEKYPEEFLLMIEVDGAAYTAEISGSEPEIVRPTFPEITW